MADEETKQAVAGEAAEVEKKPARRATKKAETAEEEKAATAAVGNKLTVAEIIAAVKGMTVLDLSDLVKALQTEFGVSAAAPVMAAAPTSGAPAAAATPAAEEKTEFTVVLNSFGANKINVIKAVRELTNLGLKESKDLVEGVPKSVKENVSKEEAEAAKQKLEAAGATVEMR